MNKQNSCSFIHDLALGNMQDWSPILKKIDSALNSLIPSSPAPLYDPVRAAITNGGKRIRPILTALCAASASDFDWVPAACAVELLHTFTLVHDDIMDNAGTRRGKPAIHIAFGMNAAILSGDALLALAMKSLASSGYTGELLGSFSDGFQAVCEGQALDEEFEQHENILLEEYLTMIELKTARIFELAAALGAIVVGGKNFSACRAFAREIGIAFQLQDDLLDLTGTESFGKRIGGDILEAKRTILYVLAMEYSEEMPKGHQALLERLRTRSTTETDIPLARTMFEKMGILSRAAELAMHHSQLAEAQLQNITNEAIREDLREFAQRLLRRTI